MTDRYWCPNCGRPEELTDADVNSIIATTRRGHKGLKTRDYEAALVRAGWGFNMLRVKPVPPTDWSVDPLERPDAVRKLR